VSPSLVFADYQRSGQSGGTSAVLTSASFTPANGDVIVVKAQTWDTGNAPGAPSGGGQTFTTRIDVAPGGFRPRSRISTAVVSGSPGSMTVSLAAPAASSHHDLTVEVWTNAQLAATPAVGSANAGSGTANTTVTTTADNSAVSWCAADTASVNPASRAYLSSATEDGFSDGSVGANAVFYSAYQTAATAGAQSIGLSAPSGQAWTIAGIEVLATAATAGALAGSAPIAVGALAALEIVPTVLAGAAARAIGALVGDVRNVAVLAGSAPAAVGVLDADVRNLGALAGAAPQAIGTLAAAVRNLGALAGLTPAAVGALRQSELVGSEEVWSAGVPVLAGAWSGGVPVLAEHWRAGTVS
jgi:hypothetical protein